MTNKTRAFCALFTAAVMALSELARAGELHLREEAAAPPEEVSSEIASLLQPTALQVRAGDELVWEFWWVAAADVEAEPEGGPVQPNALEPLTLLGVARVHLPQRDYRDDEIQPGTYTLRYAALPQDGNHLGVAPYDDFVLLVPAGADGAVDAFRSQRGLFNASQADTATGHPVSLMLHPVASDAQEFPSLAEIHEDHRSVQVRLPLEGEKRILLLGLVLEGHGKL